MGEETSARRSPGRGVVVALIAVSAVAVAAVTALAVTLLGGEDEAEVRLEPVATTVPDAFTDSVALGEAALPEGLVVPASTEDALPPAPRPAPPVEPVGAPPLAVPVSGSLPGLFGGTREVGSCDVGGLVGFLDANPVKAAAWAQVHGIAPSQIRGFLAGLTPVVLQRDTWVTNHGFDGREATRIPAVLQAGTAVLVDDRGLPRVKCACGNPLLPAVALPADARVRYVGDPWPTWRVEEVVEVTVDTRVSVLVLVDLAGGPPFSRPLGSAGGADADLALDDLCALTPDDPACAEVADEPEPVEEEPTAEPTEEPTEEPTPHPTEEPPPPPLDPVLAAVDAKLRSCGIVPERLEGRDVGDGYWHVTGTTSALGSSQPFALLYRPDTGELFGDDVTTMDLLDETRCH